MLKKNNDDILISVIIPVHNTGLYLEECLLSVINQTHKNIEIIVINDASTDNSLEIITKLMENDSRIKLINTDGVGGGYARNAGLDSMSGDYVAFVDSDDYIDRDMYKIMLNEIEKTNSEMCICNYSIDDLKPNKKSYKQIILKNRELMKEMYLDDYINSHLWSKLYPKKCFIGNRFSNKKVVHDMAIDHILTSNIKQAVYIDLPLYMYRQNNPSNLSNSNKNNYASSYFRAMVMMERIEFADKNYPELANIVIPKAVEFLLASYAKVKYVYKGKEEMDYILDSIKKEHDRFMNADNVPWIYKKIIDSISKNHKLLPYFASMYYLKKNS